MTDPTPGDSDQPNAVATAAPGVHNDPGVPKELLNIGIGFSCVLILGGLAAMTLDRLFSIGGLAVCIGLGIALTVFGTRAGGRFLKFNIVGGGAMALALYLLLVNFSLTPPPTKARYLLGHIYDTGELNSVRVEAMHNLLTGRTDQNSDFRFVAFEDEIGEGVVKFNFDLPEGNEPREFSINCIDSDLLRAAIQKGELTLALEPGEEGRHRLIERSTGREVGRWNAVNCAVPAEPSITDKVGFLDWLSISAYAQESPIIEIPSAVALLESEDGQQRDLARGQLAALRGEEAYETVVSTWNVEKSSYRADLGRLVAWSTAISRDRNTAVTLAEVLSPAQLRYLVQLTGQGDITMRGFATDVLHRLLETTSWPSGPSEDRATEIVAATIAALDSPPPDVVPKPEVQFDPDKRLFNTVVAIDFTQCNIGATYRPIIMDGLTSFASKPEAARDYPNTTALIRGVLATLGSCG